MLMDIFWKYVVASFTAKISVKFKEINVALPKNSISYLFCTSVHNSLNLFRFCWEYLDASKMVILVKIGVMQTFFSDGSKLNFFWKLVNFKGLLRANQMNYMLVSTSKINPTFVKLKGKAWACAQTTCRRWFFDKNPNHFQVVAQPNSQFIRCFWWSSGFSSCVNLIM